MDGRKREYDQIIIVEDHAYGFNYFAAKNNNKYFYKDTKWGIPVQYLGKIPDINLLKKTLKRIYPNTSIIECFGKRWKNIPKYIRERATQFYAHQNAKPVHDFLGETREAKINSILE